MVKVAVEALYTTMVSLLCHLHFWTLKPLSPGSTSGGNTGTHSYHEKTADIGEDIYRRQWAEDRGITWTPHNKKPERLRDTLKECEELLTVHRPICMKWKTRRHCLLLLSNGILLTYTVAKHSGDVERVLIDKTLVGKLQATADHGVVVGSSVVLTLTEDPRPVCVSLRKPGEGAALVSLTLVPTDSGKRLEKLSARDPKVSHVAVQGMPAGRVQRNVVCSERHGLVAVWWRDRQEAGWQWSSMAGSSTHNITLFELTASGRLEYACGVQTEGDPINIQFSDSRSCKTLYSLEKTSRTVYDSCVYEYSDGKLVKVLSEGKITSEANVSVCERDRNETKLLLGCDNGTLILHDTTRASQQEPPPTARVFFSPISLIRWHPSGSCAVVCSPRGELQCFDLSLTPLSFLLASEDPAPSPLLQIGEYFIGSSRLELAGWSSTLAQGEGHTGCHDNFIMIFDRGPVVLLRLELGVVSRGCLGAVELLSEYIRHNTLDQAVNLLSSMSWSQQPKDCFACLTFIMDHLLVQPLSATTERQLERSLATFFQAPDGLVSRQVLTAYHSYVTNLRRRFFHLLLRHRRLERAFTLAEDINAKDLFMDIHFVALGMGEAQLAELAKKKAVSVSSSDSFIDAVHAGVSSSTSRFLQGLPTSALPAGRGGFTSPPPLLLHPSLAEPLSLLAESDDDDDLGSVSLPSVSSSSYCSHNLDLATAFESSTDHSSVRTASEGEEYSDNDATQEAT